jgi:hypothetical protein
MRAGVNHGLAWIALVAVAITATGAASEPQEQEGQNQWVPSLAITGGATLQNQSGTEHSVRVDSGAGTTTELRPSLRGDDRAVSPFMGGALELMTPALSLPGSPRFFATAEALSLFASSRQIVNEGTPGQLAGPEINSLPAKEETDQYYLFDTHTGQPALSTGPRPPRREFFADEARGQGSNLIAQVDQLAFGIKAGVSFSFSFSGRQLRIKPSVGWMQYEIDTKGILVNPTCMGTSPASGRCTTTYDAPGDPTPHPGFMRGTRLIADDTGVFDGVGPGIDLEMDTGRFGPIGTSLFVGLQSYYIPGDRDIDFRAARTFDDQISQVAPAGPETERAEWHFRAAPWVHRGSIGIRFQWLGSGE